MFDLAGNSKKTVAPDIEEYIIENPSILSLFRADKEIKISKDDIEQLDK